MHQNGLKAEYNIEKTAFGLRPEGCTFPDLWFIIVVDQKIDFKL